MMMMVPVHPTLLIVSDHTHLNHYHHQRVLVLTDSHTDRQDSGSRDNGGFVFFCIFSFDFAVFVCVPLIIYYEENYYIINKLVYTKYP